MIATASLRRIAIGLMLLSIITGVSIASATSENGYKADNSFLTDTSESTRTENGYKISIMINPNIVGIHAEENGYELDLAICPEGVGGALEENGYRLDLVPEKPFPDEPDIAITGMVTSRTVMPQVYLAIVNVTVANKALDYETFQVIVNANASTICTQNVTLTGATSATIVLSWDVTGFAMGNYTIVAYAWPVPGETNTADNNFTYGFVLVTIMGDVDGNGNVNVLDAIDLSSSFGKSVGQAGFNANADFDDNGIVNILDAITLANNYNQHYP